jgi:DNA recombination protein RmuC
VPVPQILYLVAGLTVGFTLSWVFLKARAERSFARRLAATEDGLRDALGAASAASAREEELRRQAERDAGELRSLRDALDQERLLKTRAETELKASLSNLAEQKSLLENMKAEMSDTFRALSSAALKSSNEDFLRLASERLGKVVEDTRGRLGEHREAMEGLVKPLSETLRRYEEQLHSLEKKRARDYVSLDEQIKMLTTTHRDLQKETGNLVTALRKPHIRGRWGEVTLRNVVELTGMSAHCDFREQVSVASADGRLRPDMVIRLPGEHELVVDSKVSLEALLEASSAETEELRRTALKRHASHVKEHVARLSSKGYWTQFERSPELVILFMGEAALAAALENDSTLLEESMEKRVLIATPTTLFALLTAVASSWRQQEVARNAETIAALGKELYGRISVWAGHLSKVGVALGRLTDAYNQAVGSMESRVLPSARRFRDLGATAAEEIEEVKKVEQSPRNLNLID